MPEVIPAASAEPLSREATASLLNEARIRLSMSIRAAARVAGVPATTVQGWLNGKHLPTPALRDNYRQLVEALGLGVAIPDDWWVDESLGRLRPRLRDGQAPYLGLRPFAVIDQDLFHGRDATIDQVTNAILAMAGSNAQSKIVALVGPSGSGKSSLLAAGILGRQRLPGGPLAGWAAALADVRAGSRLADRVGVTGAGSGPRLLVLDQFEDAFRLPIPVREGLLADIAGLGPDTVVVIGLRSDAFALALEHPVLAAALSRPVLVMPLERDELREVILAPAGQLGVSVDPQLVDVLQRDLALGNSPTVDPHVLPLLSNALLMTWAATSGERMTVADYLSTGGVASAVERLAEGVYESLSADEKGSAKAIFLHLVGLDGDQVGRASLSLDALDQPSRRVMELFVAARMLTLTTEEVRISHEALLTNWPRLAGWIDEGRNDLYVLQQFKRASQLWVDSARDSDSLLPVKRLPMFQALTGETELNRLLTPDELDFIETSSRHFDTVLDKEQRISHRLLRRGRISMTLAALAVSLTVLTGLMYGQSQQSEASAHAAQREAQSRQVSLAAAAVQEQDPNLQAQLALIADRLSPTLEAESAVLDATSVPSPLRWVGTGPAVLAATPDGDLVVRGDGAGQITVWRGDDLTTTPGTTVEVDPSLGPLNAIALTRWADGRALLAIAGTGQTSLWDLTGTATKLVQVTDTDTVWSSTAFTPDGRFVAFGDRSGRITLYDIAEPARPVVSAKLKLPRQDAAERVPAVSIAFDPMGRDMYVGGRTDQINRWRLGKTPRELPAISYRVGRPARAIAVSPSGEWLVAGLYTRQILRWRLDGVTATPAKPIRGFLSHLDDVTFSPDGRQLLAAGDDHVTYVFDGETAKLRAQYPGPTIVQEVAWVKGRVVTTSVDGALRVWPSDNPVLRDGPSTGYSFATDTNGRNWLALSTVSDGVSLWGLADGVRRMPDPQVHLRDYPGVDKESLAAGVSIDPEGRFLIAGTNKGRIVTWSLSGQGAANPTVIEAIPDQYIGAIAISRDARLVAAVAMNDGSAVMLYRCDGSGRLTALARIPATSPQSASFSADGKLLAIPLGVGNALQLWSLADPSNPHLATTLDQLGATPTIATFAPSSPLLAAGTEAGEVLLWDTSNPSDPRLVSRYGDAHAGIYGLNFSPDEKTIMGSGGDNVVWAWDLTRPNSPAFAAPNGKLGRTNDVIFIHDGTNFAATGATGDVRLWTATPDTARAKLCSQRGSPLTADEWQRFLPGIEPFEPCS